MTVVRKRRSGRASVALTKLVLATYGDRCWLRLPGCTGRATTKDHVIPFEQGGTDALSNLRPACKACNSKRQNRNHGSRVKVITGPPAAGKSTYARQNAGPHDVIIDLDRIALSIMHPDTEGTHHYPDYIRHIAIGMRSTAITRATRLRESVTVWLIHSVPNADQLEEYQRMRWQVIEIDPGAEVVAQRNAEQRPAAAMEAVARWYEQTTPAKTGTVAPSRDWG